MCVCVSVCVCVCACACVRTNMLERDREREREREKEKECQEKNLQPSHNVHAIELNQASQQIQIHPAWDGEVPPLLIWAPDRCQESTGMDVLEEFARKVSE